MRSGALALGFLTGINLCPPFLVAGVRAAQLEHLWAALLFFVCFFAGTAVWFLPFLSMGLVQRTPAVVDRGTHGGRDAGVLVRIFRSLHPD